MGADEDVHAAVGEALHGRPLLGGGAEARDVLERERVVREPLGEGPEMLLREDRRRHQHQHLLAGLRGLEGGAQRDLGLAVADVAADQPVHRPRRFHVRLTSSIASRWSGVSENGKRSSNSRCQSESGSERVPRAPAALGVEAEQLPGELLRGSAGPRLHRLPARAAEFAQGRVLAAGADVAGDLRELVGGDEHAVIALVFEIQVVACHVRDRARLKAREASDAVILVNDDVAGSQLGEGAQRAAAADPGRAAVLALGAPPAQQAMLREHRERELRRDEALFQGGRREAQRGLDHLAARAQALAEPRRFHAAEVVGRSLALAAPREADDGPVAGAHELLELAARLRRGSAPRCPRTARVSRSPARRRARRARSARAARAWR